MSKIANEAEALAIAERLATTAERDAIVKWLKERAAMARAYTAGEDTITREQFATSIEGYAAAIERGSHRK